MVSVLRSRVSLHLEVLALRHQLAVLQEGGRHLRRILQDYLAQYHSWRCHQSLDMDCPEPRAVQPPITGEADRRSQMLGCTSFAHVHRSGGAQRHEQEFSGRTT